MSGHFREECLSCNTITSQCRCMDHDKAIKYVICDDCRLKGRKIPDFCDFCTVKGVALAELDLFSGLHGPFALCKDRKACIERIKGFAPPKLQKEMKKWNSKKKIE